MANQQANIIVSATDRFSGVLINAAARLGDLNKRMSKVGQVSQAFGLVGEQMAPRWEKVTTAFSGTKSAGQWMAGLTATVGGAGAALVGLAKSSADAIDKIGDLSGKFQINSEALQVYSEFVKEDGGSIEDAAASIGKLKKSMNEAMHGGKEQAAAFAGVGISLAELKQMKPEQVMERMAAAFKGSDKDMAKQAVLLELMGKGGEVMMGAMNRGADAYKQKLAEMREDGRIASEDQKETADKFSNAWQRVTGVFEGLKNALGLDLAKVLLPIIENVRRWAVANRELIQGRFAEFLKHLPALLDDVWLVTQAVWKGFSFLADVVKVIGHTLGMTNTVILGAAIAFAALIVSLASASSAVFGFLRAGWALLGPWGQIAAVVIWFASVVYSNWDSIVGYVESAWNRIKDVFEVGFFDGLIQVWLEQWQALANGILGVIKSIPLVSELPAIKNIKAFTFATDRAESLKYGGRSSHDNAESVRLGNYAAQANPAPMTAADAARTQKTEVGGLLRVEINAEGRPRVTEVKKAGPAMDIDVMSGLSMVGS